MKKFLGLVLAFMLIAGVSLPAMAYEMPETIQVINADTIVEAESLTPYGTNMKIINEAEASGGKMLYPNGKAQTSVPDADKEPMLIFNVYSPLDLSGAVYSNTTRSPANMWDTIRSNYYGYNLVFVYANVGSSFLMNPNVTKITKCDTDYSAGADPTKVYEFKLTKPATVYITAASQSTYIPTLNKGWTYEFNTDKYALYRPAYVDVTMDDGKMMRIPTGSSVLSDVAQGHAYYKHFEAGENIEIPAHAATASSRKLGIFIVWDEK